MKTYILFDGRANYDVDEAEIMEYIGELPSDEAAIRYVRDGWVDMDCVLFSYDSVGNESANETLVKSF